MVKLRVKGGTMKYLLALLLALSFITFAQEDPAPVSGGTVTVSIVADPPGWDPTKSTSQEIARVMYNNVYEGLTTIAQDGTIQPRLAESWTTSEDGLTWTFTLLEGVKFHDGTDLAIDDIVAAFARVKDPESGFTHPEYFTNLESVTAGEGNTVVFKLTAASSGLLYNLARPDSIIYPAAKADTQTSEPIGTGPFTFAEYVVGSEVRLEKFADYYVEGVPLLDAAVFKIIPDANATFAALQAGDIDMIGVSVTPEIALQVETDPNLKLVNEGSSTAEITMALNNSKPPLDNPLVRQAITHAVDKESIVQGAFNGLGTVIGTHATPAEPYFVDVNPYPYDPEKAKALLTEAGYADGLTLNFEVTAEYPLERTAAEVIAQQLSEVGITANLTVIDFTTWLQKIYTAHDYDMTIIGHAEPRDISIYGNPDYYYQYNNPKIAELLTQIEATPGEAGQIELYKEIATIIANDAVNVWVYAPSNLVAARKDIYGFWKNAPTVTIDMTGVYRAE
jgi:peptide/nickel transport system substrate-binding protein